MKRYLRAWLLVAGLLMVLVALFNIWVDPHDLSGRERVPGLNGVKPRAAALTKAHQILNAQPRTLILGNSRAEVGLNPRDAAWPAAAQPVYNLALPGRGIEATILYLEHALAAARQHGTRPGLIVWGLDFVDFLADPVQRPVEWSFEKDGSYLQATPRLAWQEAFQRGRDIAKASLTLGGTIDSVQTVLFQGDPFAADLDRNGFNPMRDYVKLARDEGYHALFAQKDASNMRSYFSRPRDLTDAQGRPALGFEQLSKVLRLCREQGIEVRLLLYPYHAHFLEIIRMTGHWEAYERWKQQLVTLVESNEPGVRLYDFGGYSEFTTEAIPAAGDRRSTVRWYWEAGHFKSELGHEVLARIFDARRHNDRFGIELTRATLDDRLAQQRELGQAYRQQRRDELGPLRQLAAEAHFLRVPE